MKNIQLEKLKSLIGWEIPSVRLELQLDAQNTFFLSSY